MTIFEGTDGIGFGLFEKLEYQNTSNPKVLKLWKIQSELVHGIGLDVQWVGANISVMSFPSLLFAVSVFPFLPSLTFLPPSLSLSHSILFPFAQPPAESYQIRIPFITSRVQQITYKIIVA